MVSGQVQQIGDFLVAVACADTADTVDTADTWSSNSSTS